MLFITRFTIFVLLLASNSLYGQYIKEYKDFNKTDKQGRKQGRWIVYGIDRPEFGYEDSAKFEEGEFVDGLKEGIWKSYNGDGSISNTIHYKKGLQFDPQLKITQTIKPIPAREFKPPVCGNSFFKRNYEFEFFNSYSYVAPKFGTFSYFPLLYIGENIDTLVFSYYSFIYPSKEDSLNAVQHRDAKERMKATQKNIFIHFTTDRFWVAQPALWGEDTMLYQSASAVIIQNISKDTIDIGNDMILDLKLQVFEGNKWMDTKPNEPNQLLFESLKGRNVLYPNEIIVTAMMLYEGEKRKMRIVMGDYISNEFQIFYN